MITSAHYPSPPPPSGGPISLFCSPDFGEIRTFTEPDGTVLFCGSDVARALGYLRPKDAVSAHCRGAVKRRLIDNIGRTQEANFIPKSDVYRLAARSKLPNAEKFERWIFEEVLPSIERTGGYSMQQRLPTDYLSALESLVAAERERVQLAERLVRDKPYADFGRAVEVSQNAVKLEVFAKAMCNRYGSQLGRNKLFRLLRKKKVLYHSQGTNLPLQQYINAGYFEVKETPVPNKKGNVFTAYTTLITGKGQVWLAQKLDEWLPQEIVA